MRRGLQFAGWGQVDPVSVAHALMDRPYRDWPAFVCVGSDELTGHVCRLVAGWMKKPVPDAETYWTYCDRHRPAGAVEIPGDVPYAVTRLELRVAIAGPPGDLQASASEAIRLAAFALEDVGATITRIRVVGGKASQAGVGVPPLRLQLAGRPRPIRADDAFLGPPEAPPWWRWTWRRRTG